MRFEALRTVKMPLLILRVVTAFGFADRYQHFEEPYCFHLQDSSLQQYIPPKLWYLPESPHGVSFQSSPFTFQDLIMQGFGIHQMF
jgi:hypothetical protein